MHTQNHQSQGLVSNQIKLLQVQLEEKEKNNATLKQSLTILEKQNDRLYNDKMTANMFIVALVCIVVFLMFCLLKG